MPTYPVPKVEAIGPKSFSSIHPPNHVLDTFDSITKLDAVVALYRLKFFWHCLTVAIDSDTRIRPGVRPFQDFWVGIAEDITAANPTPSGCYMQRLALGPRICSDEKHSVHITFRYSNKLGDTAIQDAGLIAIPTRNVMMSRFIDEDPATALGIETTLYRALRRSIPSGAHKAVQLTFSPFEFPLSTHAELIFNIDDCNSEVGYCRWWLAKFHSTSENLSGGAAIAHSGIARYDGVDGKDFKANGLVGFVDEEEAAEPVAVKVSSTKSPL